MISKILNLLHSDPKKAKVMVDNTIIRLKLLSKQLEEVIKKSSEEEPKGIGSKSSMGDQVRIQLVGPDGKIKQDITTS